MHPDYAHIGAIDDKLIEEMAELTQELCKVKRFGMNESNKERIRMEMFDVQARLNEYREYLDNI
jgi:hypothetical protein